MNSQTEIMTAIYFTTVVGPDFLYKPYRKSRIKLINSAYREGQKPMPIFSAVCKNESGVNYF